MFILSSIISNAESVGGANFVVNQLFEFRTEHVIKQIFFQVSRMLYVALILLSLFIVSSLDISHISTVLLPQTPYKGEMGVFIRN